MKKITRKILLSAVGITCLLSLSACQNEQQRQNKAQHTATKQDMKLPTGNYFVQDQQHRSFMAGQQRGLHQVTKQMNNNYRKIGTTTYNSRMNTITLSLQGQRTENTLKLAKQGNGQAVKFWKQLTNGLNKTVNNVAQSTKDPKLTIAISNHNVQQKPLYAVQKNHVLFNHLTQK